MERRAEQEVYRESPVSCVTLDNCAVPRTALALSGRTSAAAGWAYALNILMVVMYMSSWVHKTIDNLLVQDADNVLPKLRAGGPVLKRTN